MYQYIAVGYFNRIGENFRRIPIINIPRPIFHEFRCKKFIKKQIINNITENGAKFDFETYRKILMTVKDSSISNDVVNRRLKEIRKKMSESCSAKDDSD